MIKFTVEPPGKYPFSCIISLDTKTIQHSLWLPENFIENPLCCRKCYDGELLNHCNLLDALLPVLVYFSDLFSFEQVVINYEEGNKKVVFTDTAAQACFILCIYVMCHSACDFFKRFKPFLKPYKINITHEIFLHFVLTTALIRRQLDYNDIAPKIDIFTEVKGFMDEVNRRMAFILQNIKPFYSKDAAINSLNTMFSLSLISSEYLKEYYHDLITIVNDMPQVDNNSLTE